MEIRQATLNDLQFIQQLGHELLEYERTNFDSTLDTNWPYSEAGLEKYRQAISTKYTLIAFDSNKPVGYLIGSLHHPPIDSARHLAFGRIENIFVRTESRSKGIGQKLFEIFRNHCKSQGINRLEVLVNSKNTTALNFYKKINFTPLRLTLSQQI